MTFIKWLGMHVPEDVERRILDSDSPVNTSVSLLKELLGTILLETAGSGVPLGINVESLSIFKEEIDAAHELFQSLQALLLNSRGSPWAVRWFCVRRTLAYAAARASEDSLDQYEAHAAKLVETNKKDAARRRSISSGSIASAGPGAGGRGAVAKYDGQILTLTGVATALVAGIVIGRLSAARR